MTLCLWGWEPECRKRPFFSPREREILLPKTRAPENLPTGEGGPRGGCRQPGRHPQSFRELPLPGAEIWRQKSTGENSGSTKGNFSGSPKIFPQPGEKFKVKAALRVLMGGGRARLASQSPGHDPSAPEAAAYVTRTTPPHPPRAHSDSPGLPGLHRTPTPSLRGAPTSALPDSKVGFHFSHSQLYFYSKVTRNNKCSKQDD